MQNNTSLRHLDAPLALTDGGLETTLIFDDGFDLPHFAAIVLLDSDEGRAALDRYVDGYVDIARDHGVPVVVETPTWRASTDWGAALGLGDAELAELNRRAVAAVASRAGGVDLVVSGCVGPRGDGYVHDDAMTVDEAAEYHRPQISWLADGGADLVSAITMTNSAEAAGFARAASDVGVACVVSFTVETDGRLPSGETLGDAIQVVDQETDSSVAYFMINCAHPTHFAETLSDLPWMNRIRGIRSNASTMSHEELDAADELDAGDPVDLAERYARLRERFEHLTIFGGCCGTDTRHIAAVAQRLA